MADILYRLNGGAWTLAAGVAVPYAVPGAGLSDTVEIFGHPEAATAPATAWNDTHTWNDEDPF